MTLSLSLKRSILRDREECWIANHWHEVTIRNQGVHVCEYRGIFGLRDFDSGQAKFLSKNIQYRLVVDAGSFGFVFKNLQRMNTERTSTINRPGGG